MNTTTSNITGTTTYSYVHDFCAEGVILILILVMFFRIAAMIRTGFLLDPVMLLQSRRQI